MKFGKWVVALILFGLIIVGFAIQRPTPLPVQTIAAAKGPIRSYVEDRGTTRLPEIHQITMPLQGRVRSIELKEGDCVQVGQVVAQMDTSDLDTDEIEALNTVKRYQKNMEQMDLAIQQAEQTVVASREVHKFHEKEFGRVSRLRDTDVASESTKNQAELRMIEARTELKKDELNLSMYIMGRGIFELMLNTEQAKLEKVQRDRKRALIHSPVNGVVLQKSVSNERVLQAGTSLLDIGDLATVEVETDLLSQDVADVEVGDPVDISGPAVGNQSVPGIVTRVFPQGFTKISSLGVEQQRVKVVVGLTPEAHEKLGAIGHTLGVGYRVDVKVYTADQPRAIVVPRTSLFRSEQGTWQVFVVQDRTIHLTEVSIGLRNPYFVEVVNGVVEGDQVVVAPDANLVDGALVEVQPTTPEEA